jgi:hypothetical protein
VIDVALQVLDTLEYLHDLEPPVIYRDLKPSNVMIVANGQAKLIDFGIARHFQPLQNATMIGTQGYAPPEQYRGKVELRSDLYALGATMHHALSGRDPANEPPFSFPPLATLCPSLRPGLAALIDHALAYDVERRVPSAAEFKQRLTDIRDGVVRGSAPGASDQTGPNPKGGPVNSAAQPRPGQGGGRSQLKLPLGGGGPQGPVSPSAPTVLRTESEIDCPRCRRAIPSDSRFCSFCGTDITVAPGPQSVEANSNAETVLLSIPQSEAEQPHIPHQRQQAPRRAHGARRPILVLVLIFVGAFAAVRMISCLNLMGENSASVSPASRRAAIPAPVAPAPVAPGPGFGAGPDAEMPPDSPPTAPSYLEARLAAFREALDAGGLTGVRFRMVGGTMELWGTVPDATDKAMVQMLALNVVGVASLKDHIRVQNSFP